MQDVNVTELKEKAKSKNVLDKLKYTYSLVENIMCKDKVYTEFQSFKNTETILKELINNKDLTRHLGKRNFESYMYCKEQVIYMLEHIHIYEKDLQGIDIKAESTSKDLSKVIINANLTFIIEQLESIIVIIDEGTRALVGN